MKLSEILGKKPSPKPLIDPEKQAWSISMATDWSEGLSAAYRVSARQEFIDHYEAFTDDQELALEICTTLNYIRQETNNFNPLKMDGESTSWEVAFLVNLLFNRCGLRYDPDLGIGVPPQ